MESDCMITKHIRCHVPLKCCFLVSVSCAIKTERLGVCKPQESRLKSLHRKVGFSLVKGVHDAVDICVLISAGQ